MSDENILEPDSLEFYKTESLMPRFYVNHPRPPGRLPRRDTPDELLKAANKAHSNVRLLVEVNDRLRHDQLQVIELLKTERAWRKWMVRVLIPALLGIIAELLKR